MATRLDEIRKLRLAKLDKLKALILIRSQLDFLLPK